MTDYKTKAYGRNNEVKEIFKVFKDNKDVSMHGPRRLGKTFVLDRMVEQGTEYNFVCLKVDLAGCTEPKMVFQRICQRITSLRTGRQKNFDFVVQRMSQMISPRDANTSHWYQPFLSTDWETYLERLLKALNEDTDTQWAILIDELPIFLKALHDKGTSGINQALDFMNLFSKLRAEYPRVRWLITGSIGIGPLAQIGKYQGALAKFENYLLEQLSMEQAHSFIQDLPESGMHYGRNLITDNESKAIIEAVGWRAAYYLEAFAQKLPATPETDLEKVKENINSAMESLLKPHNKSTFSSWEEHITKHHTPQMQKLSFDILSILAAQKEGLSLDALLSSIQAPDLNRKALYEHLMLLIEEGFLYKEPFEDESAPFRFRIALLKLWWHRFHPFLPN